MAKRSTHTSHKVRHFGRHCRLSAAGAILAGVAAIGGAQAQQPPPAYGLFSPTPDVDPHNPPYFQKKPQRPTQPARPSRSTGSVGRIPTYGYPPASGAGDTGFNSTNAPLRPPSPASGSSSAATSSSSTAEPPGDADALPITAPVDEPIAPADAALLDRPPDDEFAAPGAPPRKRRPRDLADPYDPIGVRAGSFILKPAIELSGGYNSNPAQTTPPAGNSVLIVAPQLSAQSDWSRHELRADLRGSFTDYPGLNVTPSVNRPLVDSKVNARIDVTHQTRIDLEGRLLLSTEDPNSPNLPAGLKVLPITLSRGATAGVTHSFNRFELGASGSFDRVTYANSELVNGSTASNADRNYDQYGVKLRGAYELSPGVKPFVEIGADKRVHDLSADFSGIHRDSSGKVASIGSTFELTRQLTGTLSAGYATRHYEDPTLQDLNGIVADGKLVWTATPLTTMTLTARSTVDETILPGVSGELRRDFGVQADHSFRRWLIGSLKFGYGWSDYVGSTRVDQRYLAGGLLTYKLSREVWLKGEVRREWQTSNVLGGDYAANIFLVGIRLQR